MTDPDPITAAADRVRAWLDPEPGATVRFLHEADVRTLLAAVDARGRENERLCDLIGRYAIHLQWEAGDHCLEKDGYGHAPVSDAERAEMLSLYEAADAKLDAASAAIGCSADKP